MAAKITSEMEKAYLEAKGTKCLFCESKNIEADSTQADGPIARSDVTCNDCEESWTDIFTLTGVSE